MRKLYSLIFLIGSLTSITISPNVSIASDYEIPLEQNHDLVARSAEANAALYAVKREGLLEKIYLKVNGSYKLFPNWKNVDNPNYAPVMYFRDIDQDGKKEMIIVLTTGYGTGLFLQEVHVLHEVNVEQGKIYSEVYVEDPIAIVLKNVETKLTKKQAEIKIGDTKTVINLEKLQIEPQYLFSDIVFSNLIRFRVEGNELISAIGGQISPTGMMVGRIKVTYVFKNKMYQAKRIEFIPEM